MARRRPKCVSEHPQSSSVMAEPLAPSDALEQAVSEPCPLTETFTPSIAAPDAEWLLGMPVPPSDGEDSVNPSLCGNPYVAKAIRSLQANDIEGCLDWLTADAIVDNAIEVAEHLQRAVYALTRRTP